MTRTGGAKFKKTRENYSRVEVTKNKIKMTVEVVRFHTEPMNMEEQDLTPEEEEKLTSLYKARTGKGRKSISGERYDPNDDNIAEPFKVVPKSDEQRKRLRAVSSKILLLNRLDEEQLNNVLDAMEERNAVVDEIVIQQGDDGDNFYIIEQGTYDIIIGNEKVGSYDNAGFFGELALMYNMPRAATIKSTGCGTLWSLDRKTFRKIIVQANATKRRQFEQFLQSVPILENINEDERSKIADVMEMKKFSHNDMIIRQGDEIDSSSFVYFLISGNVAVIISDPASATEKEIKQLESGSYFGELALLTREPRKATIKVVSGEATAGVLDVNAFERLMGPCKELMSREIDRYAEEIANLKI